MIWRWQVGGPTLPVILGAGFVATVVFFYRLFHLHRAQIRASDFLEGLFTVLRRGNRVEAVSLCEETPGPVPRLVRAALLCRPWQAAPLRTAIERAGRVELRRLQGGLGMLATIAQIAPILGLLGTVLGMVESLAQLRAQSPLVHAADLAEGLQQALLSTAAGLGVAVAAYAFHNTLVGRIERILHDMEMAALELSERLPALDAQGEHHVSR